VHQDNNLFSIYVCIWCLCVCRYRGGYGLHPAVPQSAKVGWDTPLPPPPRPLPPLPLPLTPHPLSPSPFAQRNSTADCTALPHSSSSSNNNNSSSSRCPHTVPMERCTTFFHNGFAQRTPNIAFRPFAHPHYRSHSCRIHVSLCHAAFMFMFMFMCPSFMCPSVGMPACPSTPPPWLIFSCWLTVPSASAAAGQQSPHQGDSHAQQWDWMQR